MTISFNQIPGNLRVPFFYAELNPAASPYQSISRLLLIGQKTSAGTATADQPIQVTGGEDTLFGAGSQLAAMYEIARAQAPFQEIWALPIADAGGSTKAAGTIAFSKQAPWAAPGTIVVYVGGKRISVPVTTSMTNTQIAAALVTAINTCPKIQVSAANVAGVAASKAVTITLNAPGSDQSIPLTVNGVVYSVPVLAADTAAQIAAKLAAAVTAASGVSAAAVGAVITFTALSTGTWGNAVQVITWVAALNTPVTNTLISGTNDVTTLTANNGGTLGNGIRIETRLNPDDSNIAEAMLTITQPTSGAGDPSIANALTNLGDEQWDFVVNPWCQSTYLDTLDAWLANRWSPNSQTYGLHFTALVGSTAGAVTAFTTTRNSQFTHVLPMYNSPQPAYLLAAAFGAVAAVHLQDAPELSRPLQTLELVGIRAPKNIGDRWSITQRQSFYYAGSSGVVVDSKTRRVFLDRVISTYQRDAGGNPDQSFLNVNILAQHMYGIRYLRQYISETYPRAALVDSNPNQLQDFVTPADVQNAAVHAYKALVGLGVYENADLFSKLLVVERNKQDPNRVDMYLPTDAVNQLNIVAANFTSYVQYPAA